MSLVEACVVTALTGLLATQAVPSMRTLIDNRRIDGTASQLATDLHVARMEAVSRQEGVRLTVRPQCYIVHTGAAHACDCGHEGDAICRDGAHPIKSAHWTANDAVQVRANVGSLVFDPTFGTATPAGTLRVVGPGERAVHHVVNLMGRVRSCSPGSALPGYRVC